MNITISQLNPKDWRVYKQVRLKALQSDPVAFGSFYDKESMFTNEQWQERPSNPETAIFIAKDGETSIGMVAYRIKDNHAHIWGMFVDKSYRGLGIGKKLLQEAIEKARSIHGLTKMSLDVNPVQEKALGLYTSLGFRQVATRPYLMGDGKEHLLTSMELILG